MVYNTVYIMWYTTQYTSCGTQHSTPCTTQHTHTLHTPHAKALDAGAATQGVKVDTQPVGVKVEKAEPVASVAHKFL